MRSCVRPTASKNEVMCPLYGIKNEVMCSPYGIKNEVMCCKVITMNTCINVLMCFPWAANGDDRGVWCEMGH